MTPLPRARRDRRVDLLGDAAAIESSS